MEVNTTNCPQQQLPEENNTQPKPENNTQTNQKIKHNISNKDENNRDKKKIWTTFTYYTPKIRKITNLFKQTNIGVVFKTTNTTQQLLKQKQTSNTQEIDKSGIYKLTCNNCQMVYIGRNSRRFKRRYQEHIRYIKYNNPQSAYALHILYNRYDYGPIQKDDVLTKASQQHFAVITL
jgi:hypothetical protein